MDKHVYTGCETLSIYVAMQCNAMMEIRGLNDECIIEGSGCDSDPTEDPIGSEWYACKR